MKRLLLTITALLSTYVIAHAQQQTSTEPAPFEPLTQADLQIITGNVQRPNGVVWFNNKLYASCTGDLTLYEIDASTGATITYIGGVENAHTLYPEANEANALSLWLPNYETNELLHISRQGIDRIADGLNGPWGIAALDEERFAITNLLGNSLAIVSRTGEIQTLLEGQLASPTGIALDDNTLYIANNGSTRRAIMSYPIADLDNPDGEPIVLVSGLQNTTGIAMGTDGYLYFAYSLGTRGLVGRIDPDYCAEHGGCTAEDIDIVLYTELDAPIAGLTLSDDMRLYLHTMFRPDIYWVQLPS